MWSRLRNTITNVLPVETIDQLREQAGERLANIQLNVTGANNARDLVSLGEWALETKQLGVDYVRWMYNNTYNNDEDIPVRIITHLMPKTTPNDPDALALERGLATVFEGTTNNQGLPFPTGRPAHELIIWLDPAKADYYKPSIQSRLKDMASRFFDSADNYLWDEPTAIETEEVELDRGDEMKWCSLLLCHT